MLTFHLFFFTITISKRNKQLTHKQLEYEMHLENIMKEREKIMMKYEQMF